MYIISLKNICHRIHHSSTSMINTGEISKNNTTILFVVILVLFMLSFACSKKTW